MNKYVSLILTAALLVCAAACAQEPTADLPHCTTTAPLISTTCPDGSPTTSSRADIPPLQPSVAMYDESGKAQELHEALAYYTDGMLVGDGPLMFFSLPNYMRANDADIPLVTPSGDLRLALSAREGVTVTYRGVSVYDSNMTLIAEDIPIESLVERGRSEWQGETVTVYFSVGFQDSTPDYEKRTSFGYFFRLAF